jgi:glycosyltransferase involved in cell wall biosynthesis
VFPATKTGQVQKYMPGIDPANSVTVVIPAFREEGNIEAAIDSVLQVVQKASPDYEIIVVDDGSPDKTGDFARLKAQTNPNIRVAVNASNEGFGYSFARGVKMAGKEFITVFPGDNDMSAHSLKDLLDARGSADIVISYMQKTTKRSLFRRFVSKVFVITMNLLFGLHLKYYNGSFICRASLLKAIPIKSTGLAALAECTVRLLKQGATWRAIYFEHIGRRHEKSKAFNLKSITAVLKTVWILWCDIYFSRGDKHAKV